MSGLLHPVEREAAQTYRARRALVFGAAAVLITDALIIQARVAVQKLNQINTVVIINWAGGDLVHDRLLAVRHRHDPDCNTALPVRRARASTASWSISIFAI